MAIDFAALSLSAKTLVLMLTHVPPGETMYSLELRPDCGADKSAPTCEPKPIDCKKKGSILCRPPFWADSKGGWVQFESAPAGARRYEMIATTLVDTAERLLCKGTYAAASCKPLRWSPQGKKNLGTVQELVAAGLGATMMESGFREDVQTGRGRYKKPVDLGEGRGPANEAGLMQIMVGMACRFAPDLQPQDRVHCLNNPAYREEVAQTLVGGQEAVGRAFETGLRMLAKSRNQCEWEQHTVSPEPQASWVYRMYQYYGTGHCTGGNSGKTWKRFQVYLGLKNGWHAVPKWIENYLVYRGLVPTAGATP